jgi:putative tryptophan/tyrosine transport system substrate-binding protein
MNQPLKWKQLHNGLRRFACALAILCPLLTWAETIGVLYPETREPYRQVYASIIEGIQGEYQQAVKQFAVNEKTLADSVQQWLDDDGITALVVLGNRSLASLPKNNTRPLVVGGTLIPRPGAHPGISLNPSPALLFSGLRALKSSVVNIHVVYEVEYNEWVITEAAKAAAKLGLKLHRHPVSGMREAAAEYREVQKNLDSDNAALWLPLGGPSREKSILQTILETAWTADQIVISSNLADVRRGALYALYPNNQAMGVELAQLLKTLNAQTDMPRTKTNSPETQNFLLSAVFQAVNLRTAEHLGLQLTKDDIREFEFVYPPF